MKNNSSLPPDLLEVLKDFNYSVLNAINIATESLNNSTFKDVEIEREIVTINDTLFELSDIVNQDIFLIDNLISKKRQKADL